MQAPHTRSPPAVDNLSAAAILKQRPLLGPHFSTTFVESRPALHTFLIRHHVVSFDQYYTNGGPQSDAAPKQSEASND